MVSCKLTITAKVGVEGSPRTEAILLIQKGDIATDENQRLSFLMCRHWFVYLRVVRHANGDTYNF